ncbi:MAG: cold shock protein, partial [Actinomycetota bacterium]|nr:cold shock protein [Actinomycetota bacterium]
PSGERLTAPTNLRLRAYAAPCRGPSGDRGLLVTAACHGVVSEWDEQGGYGTITADDGAEHFFHCTQLVDGTRTTEVGRRVTFDVEPGRLGKWEATNIAAA